MSSHDVNGGGVIAPAGPTVAPGAAGTVANRLSPPAA